MKEYILNYMMEQDALRLEQLLLNLGVALAVGLLIFACYRLTFTDVTYSRRFNTSLVMMALVTTLVITVISNNVALSLGMVGALSIVRFRTAIKDPRDTTFIFWALAVGICCGIGQFIVAALGSAVIFAFLLVMGQVRSDGCYMLIIRCSSAVEKRVEAAVFSGYQNVHLRVKNTTQNQTEYIYELSERTLKAGKKKMGDESINDRLYALGDVHAVNLIEQNADITH